MRKDAANNRLLYLLAWDVTCFLCACGLFGLLLLALAVQYATSGDADLRVELIPDGAPQAVGGGAVSPSMLDVLLSAGFWGSWRVQVTFFLCRMMYALSALPFLIFHVPKVGMLLSHTFATGYTRGGICVPQDTTGLSAFVAWLEERLLSRADVQQRLTAREKAKLDAALADAKQCLNGGLADDEAALRRPPPPALTERKREALLKLLEATFSPHHALFADIFPEKQICLEYQRNQRLEAARRRAASAAAVRHHAAHYSSWEEHQGERYGVAWQSDAEVTACTLCASTFKWTRRKHHCRLCGRVVCNACSRARLLPSQGSERAERACDGCAQLLDNGEQDDGAVSDDEHTPPGRHED